MKQLTINPNNRQYYSEDFIKGFECGTQRQLEVDKADIPTWIPCSERLPEEDICNSYLIAWIPANEKVKCGLPHYYQVADWEDGDWTNLDFCGHEEIVILAWMPLPEPWKGADDDSDNI